MGFLRSIHHHSNKTDLNSTSNFFSPPVQTKRLLFELGSLSCGISLWGWHLHHKLHTGSTMAPNFSPRQQWVVWRVLCCLAARGTILINTHVSFESISITYWPFSPLYFIGEDGWWRWLDVCREPICCTAEIPSADLVLSPSPPELANGGWHITVTTCNLPHLPSSIFPILILS